MYYNNGVAKMNNKDLIVRWTQLGKLEMRYKWQNEYT